MVGDDKYYVATTCNPYTNFDTFIAIVNTTSGGKCNGCQCVRYADEGCGRTTSASAVAFHAIKGSIYYIGVSSADGKGGQYHLRIDTINDTLPIVCQQALPIQALPFSYSVEVPAQWPATVARCVHRGQELKTVYFTYVGEDKQLVLSTCRSVTPDLTPIGVGVEVINNCDDNECVVSDAEYGRCGENMFISKRFESGKTYIIKVFCLSGACEMTFEMYERAQDHSKCERAMALHAPETYVELIRKENLNESAHGCDSIVQFDHGLWYNFIRSTTKPEQTYTIIAGSETKDRTAYIEFSPGCNDIRCLMVQRGEAHLRFDVGEQHQYLFIFINGTEKGMYVYFMQDMMDLHDKCTDAMNITLPYTAIHTLGTNKEQVACDTRNYVVGSYYQFRLDKKIEVDASTCFPKTTFDTAIEITKGGCSKKECVASNLDGKGCELQASKISADLEKDVDYVLNVYAENTESKLNIKQYRLVVFTLEIPANSKCDTATKVKGSEFYHQELTLNRLAYATDLGSDLPGTVRGAYFLVEADNDDYSIQVRTCSSNTTTRSFILATKSCSSKKANGTYVSYPNGVIEIETATINPCDVFGTYLTFNLSKNEKAYVFVGPTNFHEDAFIGVEFFMDPAHPNIEPTNDTDGSSIKVGWLVVCILFYCLFLLVIAVTIVAIWFIKTHSGSYSTLA